MNAKFALSLSVALMAAHASAFATSVTVNDPAYGSSNVSSYVAPAPSGIQTHIIGLYESRSDHSGADYHPMGTTYLHVTGASDTPINLVLSSYEPTNWMLDGAGVASIGTIMVNGYHQSIVTGAGSATLVDKTGAGNYYAAAAIQWPNSTGGGNTPALVAGVEAYFGTPITSFTGTYRANDISLNITAVPEGSTVAYALMGLLGLGLNARMRKRRQPSA